MLSDILARVNVFDEKAQEQAAKGHLLRAAENFGRAAEAARALGEDNMVRVNLLLRQGNMLGVYATCAPEGSADPSVLAAHRAESIALLSDAVTSLERRRVVDTLLQGKSTAAEEAWLASCVGQQMRNDATRFSDGLAAFSPLFVYDGYVRGASHALGALVHAGDFAAECTHAQFQSVAQHIVHAVELMQQPQRLDGAAADIEAAFAKSLRDAVARLGASGLDPRLVQLLVRAWEQLQRSGVVEARGLEGRARSSTEQQAIEAMVQSSLNAPGLRRCALDGCGAKEAHPAHFKSCAACRAVVYCCREHQVTGWPGHKKACKAARKAAAAADDGAGPSGV